MAFPTVTNCMDAARARAADEEGAVYTDAILLPGVQSAVRKLFRKYGIFGNPRIIKTEFYPVPAYTSVLSPATAGINDMGEPIALYERGGITTYTVDGATPSSSGLAVSTSAAHGMATGDLVTLNQLGGIVGAGGMWVVSVVDADDFTVNGLIATGTFTSGGTATKSTEKFRGPLTFSVDRMGLPTSIGSSIIAYVWAGDRFILTAANEARELCIDYYSSATVPSSGSDIIGVDDCIDFVAAEALATVALTRSPQIAVGQRAEADNALDDLIRAGTHTLQVEDQRVRSRKPYRDRSAYTSSWAERFIS